MVFLSKKEDEDEDLKADQFTTQWKVCVPPSQWPGEAPRYL